MIPTLLVLWGTIVACGSLVDSYASLCVTRVLLGMMESGIYPCLVLLLSTFYVPSELATRISYLGVAQALSGALYVPSPLSRRRAHRSTAAVCWRTAYFVWMAGTV